MLNYEINNFSIKKKKRICLPMQAEDTREAGSIPESGRFPGERNVNLF